LMAASGLRCNLGMDSGVESGFVVAPIFGGAAQVSVVGVLIIGRFGCELLLLRIAQLRFQLFGDRSRDFAFNTKNIVQLSIVTFSPDMFVSRCAD
jgi:hypothetical protein